MADDELLLDALDEELEGALVVELPELEELAELVGDVGGGDSPPSLHPATSAPPSTIAITHQLCRERTSLPLAVHGTAAAKRPIAWILRKSDVWATRLSTGTVDQRVEDGWITIRPSITVASSTTGFDNRPLCSSHD